MSARSGQGAWYRGKLPSQLGGCPLRWAVFMAKHNKRSQRRRLDKVRRGMVQPRWETSGSDLETSVQVRRVDLSDPVIQGLFGGFTSADTTIDRGLTEPPPENFYSTSACELADACEGCGATSNLHTMVGVFSGADGHTPACATVCTDCDGKSLLHLLDHQRLHDAIHQHHAHLHAAGINH
jgi:hypothetical protein